MNQLLSSLSRNLGMTLGCAVLAGAAFAPRAFATSVASAPTAATATPTFPGDVKIKLNFKNEEVTSMIETFAKASQRTFVVDPGVRGRVSVFAPEPVGLDEAFDLLSTSLALNGYAIVAHETKFVVMASRNAQRSGIPTFTEVPPAKPERYVTWVTTIKHLPVEIVNRNMRVLPSKDGDMMPMIETNQLMVTDYASTINRIAAMLKVIDQPVSPEIMKLVGDSKAKYEAAAKERMKTAKPEMNSEPAKAPKFMKSESKSN